MSIDEYIQQNRFKAGETVIEEYHQGPMNVADTTQWRTRVIYTLQT
jgi:hypothetical protein